ncbi:hypothetical protein F5Y14DRAFT_448002 [Nemania sp. NC0429]|nr:hypothetical protein F5Y14DRAFT_448002 [Nemania sp. NC0429]
MAYSNEATLKMPLKMKGATGVTAGGASRLELPKPHYKKPQRLHPKSSALDAEDLRRRLYVVIAEREAQKQRRERHRADDASPARRAQTERERDTQHLYIDRLPNTSTIWPAPDVTLPTREPRPGSAPISKPVVSRQDKTRRRTSMAMPFKLADTTTTDDDANTGAGYRHVPDQAAAQFSRTTTSNGMNGDNKPAVHSLSQTAVRFYAEGASFADRQAIESSITPGKQRSLLHHAQTQREQQHGRNQFQGAEGVVRWRRRSQPAPGPGPGIGIGIREPIASGEDEISALAALHLHTYAGQDEARRGGGGGGGGGGDTLHSSEETLVDGATANEHRIDWSQSDEMLPHEKKGGLKMSIPPLLRKTGSILTLKGKLGLLPHSNSSHSHSHSRKGSGGVGAGNNKKLRIVTIHEDCDEQAEADDGSTPMSPNSGSSRLGFWGRLRRG